MKHLYGICVLAAALTAAAQPAAAQQPYWSSIASACTPDAPSIQNNGYKTPQDNYVTPQTNNLDPIVLICGVTPNPSGILPGALSLTYVDAAVPGSVIAQLIRVQRGAGKRSIVATLNTNTFPVSATPVEKSTFFDHPLNFTDNYYYVRIAMDRTATSQNIRAIGIALDPVED